ncbi:MAG TPA: molybdopterin-dependent oxidoreductase [Clostridiales bacterium]|nr:molybdopterin-dependent oxidoreductase [Clostridiales bacterium]
MKRIRKRNLGIIITLVLLTAAVAVLAFLNAGSLERKQELEMNAEFLLGSGGAQRTITMRDILELDPVDFEAVMDTSTTDPTSVTFTGVELSRICEKFGIGIEPGMIVQVKALDGYASALTGEEVLAGDNVYICVYMNGEALKTKSEGGMGPYLMIIKSFLYSQRWCKFVEEIVVG